MIYIGRLLRYFLVSVCLSVLLNACAATPSVVPGTTISSPQLQRDTINQLFLFDRALYPDCQDRKVANTEVLEQARDVHIEGGLMVAGSWKERWYLDRCGMIVPYDVQYIADGKGGTFLRFSGVKEDAKTAKPIPASLEAYLLNAAEKGDVIQIQELLAKGADIASRDEHGRTPLMVAAVNGHTSAVTLLLEKGSNVNSKNQYGYTALHLAAGMGNAEVVRTLLSHGANANEGESQIGDVPVMSAASSGSIEAAHALLVHGANVIARNNLGTTALMRAVMNGQSEMVLYLLKSGADAKVRSNDGETALTSVGPSCLSPDAAEALIASGTYDKAEIHKAFHNVVTGPRGSVSCTDLVKFFVETGVDINHQSDYGDTALILASAWGRTEIVRFLVFKGADTLIKNKDGITALDEAKDDEIRQILKDAKRGHQ